MMNLPPHAIARFAEINGQRDAAHLMTELRHRALADGLELGREYVPDPKDPPNKSKAHYKLTGFIDEIHRLEEMAMPWVDWKAVRRKQRRKHNDEQWKQVYAAMGVQT